MTENQHGAADSTPTRRQFFTALGGMSLAATGYGYGTDIDGSLSAATGAQSSAHPASQYHVDVMTAIAEAVYPSAVSVESSFIERRVFARIEPKPDHFENLLTAIEAVDSHARARFGGGVTEMSAAHRRKLLQSMGVTAVHPTADGSTVEQIRFYIVNELLYALFTSPVGGELMGIDNPPGYPGGREAYQRGPERGER
ncbi:gluconate 2-dehydrogenase subunit 3 family protein [Halorubrum sp. N11]|uniref:gluconate 2-dehydrogenase subunit 3 family protein n=1 Tax=Halorubrum sp. N11 TaxID=3402276 RepID=UPI003EB6FED4